ncbi:MAG TPA: hypothetical protein VFT62_03065 [Mycobacteriales bacterium]|nr:hypothetical protein [Mycobacteriales bacterium]
MRLRRTHRDGQRRLVLVAGIGRSGTSACTGALAALGFAVPQPEVQADETNPRGFGEPQWVVDFHTELLRKVRVSNFDGRPAAWQLTEQLAGKPAIAERLGDWLRGQLDDHPRLVVKDPRTVWLLPLWLRVARELDVDPVFVTMLRPPPQVVASARRWYGEGRHEASRVAGWVNVMTHLERETRGSARTFVRYDDLLADWRDVLGAVEAELELGLDLTSREATGRIDAFLDPGLRREQVSWDDVEMPAGLRAVAERAWALLSAPSVGDRAAELDALRADYDRLYADAELIAQWSIAAAAADARAKAKAKAKARSGVAAKPPAPETAS